MTSLLSMTLFDHCGADQNDFSGNDCDKSSFQESIMNLNTTTSMPDTELADISAPPARGLDANEEPQHFVEDFANSVSSELYPSTETAHSNHDDWGFMTSDSGGMVTFDNDSGAADWGLDGGISMNAEDGF